MGKDKKKVKKLKKPPNVQKAEKVKQKAEESAEKMDVSEESSSDEGSDNEEKSVNEANGDSSTQQKVYVPGISRDLKEKEELVCDMNAYKILKPFQCEYPCLSFDTITELNRIENGNQSSVVSTTIVAGTQAEKVRNNGIVVMKIMNLTERKPKENEDEEEESSDSDDEESQQSSKALLLAAKIPHHGGINRIRSTNIQTATVCAVWNDQNKVQLWNLAPSIKAIEELNEDTSRKETSKVLKNEKPLFSFAGHQTEGFALDWSPVSQGKLATGDNKRRIHIWNMGEGGEWMVDQRPLADHKGSIEDIQWSPTEDNVFSSCSADSSIRLWDGRAPPTQACVCVVEKAHESDVNVLSWNRKDPFLLSGGDDGAVKVWDLKTIQYKKPVAVFRHHKQPITSVHWYPHDSTVFAASGEDDQVTIWDLALEVDQIKTEEEQQKKDEDQVPPQLLFVHAGQKDIKEIRWHPQSPGVLLSTAHDGFNLFRPVNM